MHSAGASGSAFQVTREGCVLAVKKGITKVAKYVVVVRRGQPSTSFTSSHQCFCWPSFHCSNIVSKQYLANDDAHSLYVRAHSDWWRADTIVVYHSCILSDYSCVWRFCDQMACRNQRDFKGSWSFQLQLELDVLFVPWPQTNISRELGKTLHVLCNDSSWCLQVMFQLLPVSFYAITQFILTELWQ